jgi:ubiquinone/menaquinone biosynthesis C-methylase UbiE
MLGASVARAHEEIVAAQFGPRARAYVESAVHAQGEDLDAIEAMAARLKPDHALDLGAGGGHVAYRLAKHSKTVSAADLSEEMLAAVAAFARSKGLENIAAVRCPAERLPFADATFDFAGCRMSAHHWRDFDAGLREARRVLKHGAEAVFVDACSPGAPALDTHLQAIELLRDTSHVRDYSVPEWTSALRRAGFEVRAVRTFRIRIDFASWIARMQTPAPQAQAIRMLQDAASAEVRTCFGIEADGSFQLDALAVEVIALKAGSF